MIAVIDASVAIKWFLHFKPDESDAPIALKIFEDAALGRLRLVEPIHLLCEVAAVLARVKPADAAADMRDLLAMEFECSSSPEIYLTALDLAIRLDQHLFDTLYHAVALHLPGATLITADRRYYGKAQREGHIILLADWGI